MKRMRILGLVLVAALRHHGGRRQRRLGRRPVLFQMCEDRNQNRQIHRTRNAKPKAPAATPASTNSKKTSLASKRRRSRARVALPILTTPELNNDVTCAKFKDEGVITGDKTEGKIVSIFSKCESANKACHSTNPVNTKGITTRNLARRTRLRPGHRQNRSRRPVDGRRWRGPRRIRMRRRRRCAESQNDRWRDRNGRPCRQIQQGTHPVVQSRWCQKRTGSQGTRRLRGPLPRNRDQRQRPLRIRAAGDSRKQGRIPGDQVRTRGRTEERFL